MAIIILVTYGAVVRSSVRRFQRTCISQGQVDASASIANEPNQEDQD
jgi:hypothetical protein